MSRPDLRDITNSDLFAEVKRRFECSFKPQKRVIITGPPGSGKWTQASKLSEENCWCHLAVRGPLSNVRENAGSEGIDSIDTLKAKLKDPQCSRGAVIDGFPRTPLEAQELDAFLEENGMKIDKVIELNATDNILAERITGKRVHLPSNRRYHVKFNPPKAPEVDDVTGEPLVQRDVDNLETLNKRLEEYKENTVNAMSYYTSKGILANINANQSFENVWEDILQNLK
ncbi:unnamed protein product [Blepharisma stoltei]|uniref:Adenylate kinase active site lid domain-containing protein n=1 Tax=Blepharisma stoltei TaxID=1481888 RepID=A0AAU9JE27_9CILI|nr:unnamed protein product [Blepharisma stoltei]